MEVEQWDWATGRLLRCCLLVPVRRAVVPPGTGRLGEDRGVRRTPPGSLGVGLWEDWPGRLAAWEQWRRTKRNLGMALHTYRHISQTQLSYEMKLIRGDRVTWTEESELELATLGHEALRVGQRAAGGDGVPARGGRTPRSRNRKARRSRRAGAGMGGRPRYRTTSKRETAIPNRSWRKQRDVARAGALLDVARTPLLPLVAHLLGTSRDAELLACSGRRALGG